MDGAYKFAIHYILEQQCNALPWSDYVCTERVEPRKLWSDWADVMPRIVRVPILNNYCLFLADQWFLFDNALDAWIIWLYEVRDRCAAKVKHPETGLWVSFASLLHSFDIVELVTKADDQTEGI